jgi:hypothetical protein
VKYAVGDTVRIYNSSRTQETTVETVGRKWFTVKGYREKFHLDDGANNTNYMYPYVKTIDEFLEIEKQHELTKLLRDRQVKIPLWAYPSQILRHLLDVLEAAD